MYGSCNSTHNPPYDIDISETSNAWVVKQATHVGIHKQVSLWPELFFTFSSTITRELFPLCRWPRPGWLCVISKLYGFKALKQTNQHERCLIISKLLSETSSGTYSSVKKFRYHSEQLLPSLNGRKIEGFWRKNWCSLASSQRSGSYSIAVTGV